MGRVPSSELRFVKRCAEFCAKEELSLIPRNTRGIYALLRKRGAHYDVVYVGMAGGKRAAGIRGRLRTHTQKKKARTHFSVYEVWDNVSEDEISELEGLFRHIYSRDAQANRFNRQRTFRKLKKVRGRLRHWKPERGREG